MTIIVAPFIDASARDYAWLTDALAKWSGNRTDLAALIPDFVMLAEKQMSADLESRMQELAFTLTAVAGTPTLAIPDDLAEIRSLTLPDVGPLDYLTPDQFNAAFPGSCSGRPRAFAVIGQQVFFGPTPDMAYTVTLVYRQFLPALAESAGSNWLIQRHPNAYLAAGMVEVCKYTKNLAELPTWEAKYAAAIDSINRPDWYSGSSMRVRTDAATY